MYVVNLLNIPRCGARNQGTSDPTESTAQTHRQEPAPPVYHHDGTRVKDALQKGSMDLSGEIQQLPNDRKSLSRTDSEPVFSTETSQVLLWDIR